MTDKKQNEVSENKEIPHEINSISGLSQILQKLGEPEKGYTRFFRGHGNEGWQILPSIYRAKHLIENEDKIIKDALTYCPNDFLPSDTLFEKLVKLQHYGYSTRLLDLTTNALVALYFAAQPYKEKKTYSDEYKSKDGELIILDIPDEKIKYWGSDAVTILSAISLQHNFITETKEAIKEAVINSKVLSKHNKNEILKQAEKPEFSNVNDLLRSVRCILTAKFIAKHEREMGSIEEETYDYEKNVNIFKYSEDFYEDFKSIFNKQGQITKLLQDIRTDKPHFRPVINPDDLQRVLCVRAKLNNQRISRQQGCFLLFGIGSNKTEAAVIPDEWQRLASNRQKILVKAGSKSTIRQELESFGISKRTLFPELEAQATEIMEQYNPDSKKP